MVVAGEHALNLHGVQLSLELRVDLRKHVVGGSVMVVGESELGFGGGFGGRWELVHPSAVAVVEG